MDTLDKEMIDVLGGTKRNGLKLHHAIQNSSKWMVISGIFYLIFLNSSWPWVTETEENKTVHKGDYYTVNPHLRSLISSLTLREMLYNETNFTTGQLI